MNTRAEIIESMLGDFRWAELRSGRRGTTAEIYCTDCDAVVAVSSEATADIEELIEQHDRQHERAAPA